MILETVNTSSGLLVAVTPEQAKTAGATQVQIDAAIADHLMLKIKSECGRRIYAVASAETQMNISATVGRISRKASSTRSTAEADILIANDMAIDWVADMRANIATLAADATLDFSADASWPACPPEVVALAAQF